MFRSGMFLGVALVFLSLPTTAKATNYSMGCVNKYSSAGFPTSADLSNRCIATDGFSAWFNLFGQHRLRFYWHDTLVWPSDYTEDSLGGFDNVESDWSSADLNVFSGHGSCQNPPKATDPDFIVTAKPGANNFVNIHSQLRLGEFPGSGVFGQNGNLDTLMLDASCPMDLVSMTNQWWDVFQGLHIAMGHSGDSGGHDNLDSAIKLPTVGMYLSSFGLPPIFAPPTSYRTAWMSAGLIEVQPQVCAVITATGRTEDEAVNRRDFETPTNRIADAMPPTWIAWRWVCSN
jgi:hypothetical protein